MFYFSVVYISGAVMSEVQSLVFTNATYDADLDTYEYQVTVNQNTLVNDSILTAHCSNADDPTATILYSLPPSHTDGPVQYFSIDPQSGVVKLIVDSLTLTNGARYDARIQCSVQSPQTDITASLRVQYHIQNQFAPVFSIMTQLMLSFVENNDISGDKGIIHRFNATDRDRGVCGVVEYSIISANQDLFHIDSVTGVLTFIRPLDREMKDQHTISVQAINPNPLCATTPQMADSASVDIRVNDTNDTPPVFSQAIYTAAIAENTNGPTNLLSISCTDLDLNSRVSYSIQQLPPEESFFLLSPESGSIRAEGPIDYETHSSISFLVFCEDENANTKQVSNATVNIEIIPINEHRPRFEPSSLTPLIYDTSSVGTVIASPAQAGLGALKTYTITDDDRGSNHSEITFTLEASEYDEHFHLDSKTGVLSLQRAFVKTVCGQDNRNGVFGDVQLRITGCDIQDSSTCEILTVNLYILTSNCTAFFMPAPPSNISLSELIEPGATILPLSCQDHSNFTKKTITLSTPNEPSLSLSFSLENGSLKLLKGLDFETRGSFSLQISCKNSYNTTATVEVVIWVLPENEYPPVFNKSVYIVELDSSKINSLPWQVEEIHASDKDRGFGGNVTYFFPEQHQYFTLSLDGQVSLVRDLPKSERIFSLTATATDGEFSENATVIVIQQVEETEQYEDDFITLVIVFSAVLLFLVVLLLISWILICCMVRQRGQCKRTKYSPTGANCNTQSL